MKKLLPLLAVFALATAASAQVTPEDYRAWRAAERSSYDLANRTAYQAWRRSERTSYRDAASNALQAWRHTEQASFREQFQATYRAWRRSEQAVFRAVVASESGGILIIANPE